MILDKRRKVSAGVPGRAIVGLVLIGLVGMPACVRREVRVGTELRGISKEDTPSDIPVQVRQAIDGLKDENQNVRIRAERALENWFHQRFCGKGPGQTTDANEIRKKWVQWWKENKANIDHQYTITIRPGDTLSQIATIVYRDCPREWRSLEKRWKLIQEANGDIEPTKLTDGQTLIIPRLETWLHLTDQDRQVITNKALKQVFDTDLGGKHYILSTKNIPEGFVPKVEGVHLELFSQEAIQKKADREGDLKHFSFRKFEVKGEVVVVRFGHSWTSARGSRMVHADGWGRIFEFRKSNGNWTYEILGTWIS